MRAVRSKILKMLAVISFGLVTFPFLLTNDVLAFRNISPLRIICYYVLCAAVFGVGYGFGGVIKKRKKLIVLERITGVLMFGTGLLLLFITEEINIIFALGVSAVLWYFLGERASHKHYADIFPAFMFGVYIGVTLLCYLFYVGMCERELKEPVQSVVVGAFMVELCLAALLINQSGIYDKANRRRETRTMLPKGLSGYNAALVVGVTVIGLCLYLFSDEIIWLLNSVISLVIRIILFIMSGYSEFMKTESIEQELPFNNGYNGTETNNMWQVIFAVAVIVFLIVFRKKILEAVKNLIKRIYSYFTRETQVSEAEPEFTDIFEELDSSRRRRKGYMSYSGLMKLYKNEKNPIKKYRFGYALVLAQLKAFKAGIRESDTVSVHYEKGRALCGTGFKTVTDGYDRLRYNDDGVTELQSEELDMIIKSLNQLAVKKK